MRIAQVSGTFPPYQGGTGNVCFYNARELARRGHQVTVFTAAYPPGEFSYPQEMTVKRLPVLFRFGNAPFMPGLMNLKDFDIVHLHHPFIFGAELVWAACKIRKIPYVLTHHNDLIANGLRGVLFNIYTKFATRLIFSGASKLAAVSLDHATNCRLALLFKRRWADVVEIPNGVDTQNFRPDIDGQVIRRRLGIEDEARVVLFVGGLDQAHYFKGVDLLLRAFAEASEPNDALMIIGDGDLRRHYEEIAGKLGISKRTFFTGTVQNVDLPLYYAASEIVVLPSSPPESFGLVLIEGMACGKPVIASNLPGVRSVVEQGKNGYLIQPGDVYGLSKEMQSLMVSPEKRLIMGKVGRKKVENQYSWEMIGGKLEKLYQDVTQA